MKRLGGFLVLSARARPLTAPLPLVLRVATTLTRREAIRQARREQADGRDVLIVMLAVDDHGALQVISIAEHGWADEAAAVEPRASARPAGFPRRVQQLRRRLDLSVRGLADRLGVDPHTIVSWERGLHRPRPANRQAVLRAEGHWRRWFVEMCEREEPAS